MKKEVIILDFGTSKVVALVADTKDSRHLNIIDNKIVTGQIKTEDNKYKIYDGYLNGKWNDFDTTQVAIKNVLENIRADLYPNADYICGVPAEFSFIEVVETTYEFSGSAQLVTKNNVLDLIKKAKSELEEKAKQRDDYADSFLAYSGPAWFFVDSKRTLEPIGKRDRAIKVKYAGIYVKREFANQVSKAIKELGIKNRCAFLPSTVGVAPLFLSQSDLIKPVFILDIGHLSSVLFAYQGETPIYQKTINHGGGDFQLAILNGINAYQKERGGKLINFEEAGKFKKNYSFAEGMSEKKLEIADSDTITVDITNGKVGEFITPQLDEFCKIINEEIKASGIPYSSGDPLYITGGGLIMNEDAKQKLNQKLDHVVRIFDKQLSICGEAYNSSVVGVLRTALQKIDENRRANGLVTALRNLFGG